MLQSSKGALFHFVCLLSSISSKNKHRQAEVHFVRYWIDEELWDKKRKIKDETKFYMYLNVFLQLFFFLFSMWLLRWEFEVTHPHSYLFITVKTLPNIQTTGRNFNKWTNTSLSLVKVKKSACLTFIQPEYWHMLLFCRLSTCTTMSPTMPTCGSSRKASMSRLTLSLQMRALHRYGHTLTYLEWNSSCPAFMNISSVMIDKL